MAKKAQDLSLMIAKVFNECQESNAIHARKMKELMALRASSPGRFVEPYWKTLRPLFLAQKRVLGTERLVKVLAGFAAYRDEKNAQDSDAFLEEFLKMLLSLSSASHKTIRFRSCQIISEIIMRLPDDAEVSNDVWDEVIDCMKQRMQDKVPTVRAFAVRALARFASDSENEDIVDLYRQVLAGEHNAEVRKMLVLSMPPSKLTAMDVIERTLDISDSVRNSAYIVLAKNFPLQSLSIKHRAIILQRGLADRSLSVTKECLKMLKDSWLTNSSHGDPINLLKFLDVETYELVGEAVMEELLKTGMVPFQDGLCIDQFVIPVQVTNNGNGSRGIPLIEAEVALYWRTLCAHLQTEAQAKGSDAAATAGAEAAVYAAVASDNNDLLEKLLPATVADYVDLVKAHLFAGPNYRFTSRQLLLLGVMLDFSDASNRKVASAFIKELLYRPLEHEVDEEDGTKVLIGDGINLGGDRNWARAVSDLARKVHASAGEFEDVVISVVEELACPCRERGADFMQWMHCLAVTGLLLENIKSFKSLRGKPIEASEILHSLLLPAAKHIHMDVRRVAVRCLGLFGLAEGKPSHEMVKQLRISFINGPSSVSIIAGKALFDLAMWHSPEEVDRAVGLGLSTPSPDDNGISPSGNSCDGDDDLGLGVVDLLYSGFDREQWDNCSDAGDHQTVRAVLAEGFAKMLLQSKNYPSISSSMHPLIFGKLIKLYFSEETKELHRLRQCLSVFFEQYPALSDDHKRSISEAFIPTIRAEWPGVNGQSGSPVMVSAQRRRATQMSHFMLQMMQAPLYKFFEEGQENQSNEKDSSSPTDLKLDTLGLESGEEGLAIRIGVEVVSYPIKKTAAGKSYLSALCKAVVLLHFRPSEQEAIKCMRKLLGCMAELVQVDKLLLKELNALASHIKALDEHPDQELSLDRTKFIFGKLGLDDKFDIEELSTSAPTPVAPSTRRTTTRRRVRPAVSSDDEDASPPCPMPVTSVTIATRSQRVSKTAAMSKMAAKNLELEASDEESDLTSEETADRSDYEFAFEGQGNAIDEREKVKKRENGSPVSSRSQAKHVLGAVAQNELE
ncbi:condensin complex subunit 3 [Amborella trichopoda]|uniref:Nuclear condensin complex subunit 3 C-terminal domain-containing protein n=1 Tax=Amborella trichopoda TaxID=13333 RepID=W1NKW2_AMBTC|nr:condensin complex subunit 3 [Amborella trichopoda]ERM95845.1 hypothetical protein AMTR_s00060p00100190 [Amborella trichopoda]|eukprot:XP_006828429.3 condensin complex subunit 3 [Amborella trichopoda]